MISNKVVFVVTHRHPRNEKKEFLSRPVKSLREKTICIHGGQFASAYSSLVLWLFAIHCVCPAMPRRSRSFSPFKFVPSVRTGGLAERERTQKILDVLDMRYFFPNHVLLSHAHSPQYTLQGR